MVIPTGTHGLPRASAVSRGNPRWHRRSSVVSRGFPREYPRSFAVAHVLRRFPAVVLTGMWVGPPAGTVCACGGSRGQSRKTVGYSGRPWDTAKDRGDSSVTAKNCGRSWVLTGIPAGCYGCQFGFPRDTVEDHGIQQKAVEIPAEDRGRPCVPVGIPTENPGTPRKTVGALGDSRGSPQKPRKTVVYGGRTWVPLMIPAGNRDRPRVPVRIRAGIRG